MSIAGPTRAWYGTTSSASGVRRAARFSSAVETATAAHMLSAVDAELVNLVHTAGLWSLAAATDQSKTGRLGVARPDHVGYRPFRSASRATDL
jgi:hypothetical protein